MKKEKKERKVQPFPESEKILVAFFSRSGNTRRIAKQIHQQISGSVFEIQVVNNYPADYNDVLARAKQEILSGTKPVLNAKVQDIENYDVIFIGYPNWWNTFPAPVLSFLTEYDFDSKTIIPFCTHGGGGSGHSFSDLARLYPRAKVEYGFSINGYYVSESNQEVIRWINNIKTQYINSNVS